MGDLRFRLDAQPCQDGRCHVLDKRPHAGLASWRKGSRNGLSLVRQPLTENSTRQYFSKMLIDADLASNNGGWQWSAGTGTDPQPYFRIFNPYNQSEKVNLSHVVRCGGDTVR